jgi:dynein heavy chain, axonemal
LEEKDQKEDFYVK